LLHEEVLQPYEPNQNTSLQVPPPSLFCVATPELRLNSVPQSNSDATFAGAAISSVVDARTRLSCPDADEGRDLERASQLFWLLHCDGKRYA
jgi:hypothetical protein